MLQYEDKEGNRHQSEIPLSVGNYIEFYNRLFGAIREKGSLPVNTEEAISVMKILDAAAESNRTGSIIPLS
jgi:predicted dehydrogenase